MVYKIAQKTYYQGDKQTTCSRRHVSGLDHSGLGTTYNRRYGPRVDG